ncbi:MAG: gliding motility-associated C-terminal domain-containing protein [Bacteroidota bacterium]|nr:gliding motility-associated C-terminal domain-containing protein [Bacteroidota bacterium]
MKAKKIITLLILICGLTQGVRSQSFLPYTQDNICLDELINVNANPLGNPKNLVVADFGGGGVKEVIVADATSSIIKVYGFIPASASFSLQTFFTVPGTFGIGKHRAIAAGEFTGDALLDIVFTTDSFVFVFKNNAGFNFTQHFQLAIPSNFVGQEHFLKVDDINNFGEDDFYLISSNTSVGPGITVMPVMCASSTLIPQSSYKIFNSKGSLLGASLDINVGNVKGEVDGLKDLMITYDNVPDSVFFLENNSTPSILLFNKLPVYLAPTSPFPTPDFTITCSELADVNSDSQLDFIFSGKCATGNKFQVYPGFNAFSLVLPINIPISGINVNDFKIEDINNDGVKDFVGVGNYGSTSLSGIALYPGNSTSSYFDPLVAITFTNTSMRPDELAITDVDQNGINDLVIKPWKANFDRTYLIPNFSYKITSSATPSAICGAFPATIAASITSTLPTNYNWEYASSASTFSTIPPTTSSFTTTIPGFYRVHIDFNMYNPNNTCTLASDTIKIISNAPVITVSSQNTTVCYGDYVITSASGAATYTWVSPSASPIFFGPTFSIQVVASLVYTVTGELTNGCKGTNTVSINLHPLNTDVISASKNPACMGDAVSLSMPSAFTYTWSNGSNNAVATVTPIAVSIYSLVFTDANGCSSSKSVTIDIDPTCNPKVYNGITVNGDGNNDFFEIENIEKFRGNSVKIYNRWGKEIFTALNYDNKTNYWPTPEDLKTLVPSTYFYVINYGDGSELQKGWVELMTN